MTAGQSADPAARQRLSESDRDEAVGRLRSAFAEQRITAAELDRRLEQVLSASVAGDLEAPLAGLPANVAEGVQEAVGDDARAPVNAEGRPLVGGVPDKGRTSLAVLGVARHDGRWVVPPRFTAVAVLGAVVLDLRMASLAEQETVVRSYGLLGVLRVIVPDGVQVRTGDDEPVARVARGAQAGPVVRITGLGIGGFTSVVVNSELPRPRPRRRALRWWVIRIRW